MKKRTLWQYILLIIVLFNFFVVSVYFLSWTKQKVKDKYHFIQHISEVKNKSIWSKSSTPVLGDDLTGTLFDPHVINDDNKFKMYVSRRNKKSIVLYESTDGINWGKEVTCLSNNVTSGWEADVNRACVIKVNDTYLMYYTGQENNCSRIGLATSMDGINFVRYSKDCILKPEFHYEGFSVMNPYVMYDENEKLYKMWYSAGETYEPNVVCYATSEDGVSWEKYEYNPIFVGTYSWFDRERVSVGNVIKENESYLMFYIGYEDINTANICVVSSPNGINSWNKLDNVSPIVIPSKNKEDFDCDACYKPSVVYIPLNGKIRLYYNGRNNSVEKIGFVETDLSTFQAKIK